MSKNKCYDCEHFKVLCEPVKVVGLGYKEAGTAICKKHDLVVDFITYGKLKKLTCVEDANNEKDT